MDVREKSSNGKRLIDANRALEIVRDQGIAHPNAYHLTNYATLILREAPTVDAVEVVRCKDCKWGKTWKNAFGIEGFKCDLLCVDLSPEAFCSYGVWKECDD